MVTEQGPQITIEMFRPVGRSRQTEAAYEGLLRYYYGDAGQEFAQGLQEGRFNSSSVPLFRDRIDPYFRRIFARTFPHSADTTGQSSYLEAQRIARTMIKQNVNQIYPNFSDDIFANEVALESPSPTDFFYYLVKADDGDIARYERRRHFLLSLGSAEIDSVSGNGELARHLMDINRLFDDDLFIRGSRRQVSLVAHHNVKTNGVKKVDFQKPKKVTDDVVLRDHRLTLREIEGVGLVQTRIRQKDTATSLTKMLAYAAIGDGVLNSSKVKDYMGFTLIAFNGSGDGSSADSTKVDLLIEKVQNLLESTRSINKFEVDDDTGRDRGQGGVIFKRRQVYLSDMPEFPLEIMFYDGANYLTQSHEVGELDPKTGFYTGRAYKLYALKRIADLLPYIRPQEIYGGDPRRDLIDRMHEVAKEIRYTESESRNVSAGVNVSPLRSFARRLLSALRHLH